MAQNLDMKSVTIFMRETHVFVSDEEESPYTFYFSGISQRYSEEQPFIYIVPNVQVILNFAPFETVVSPTLIEIFLFETHETLILVSL